jgi:hypothetical protein
MGALVGDDTVDSQRWRKHGGGNETGKTRGCLTVACGNRVTTETRWQTLLVFSELNNIQFSDRARRQQMLREKSRTQKSLGYYRTCPRLASYQTTVSIFPCEERHLSTYAMDANVGT